MNRKTVSFILSILIMLCFASMAYALSSIIYTIQITGNVVKTLEAEVYFDGEKLNSTTLNVYDLGNIKAGSDISKRLDIYNAGNTAFNVTVTWSGLPSGWTVSYNMQGRLVSPGQWLNGTITIHVYSGQPEGSFPAFNIYVNLNPA